MKSKRYFLGLSCVIVLLGLFVGIYYLVFSEGSFSFKINNIDLGIVEKSTTFSVKFPFINKSKEVIEIKKIVSGCACSKAEASKDIIEPGEKGFVEVELTTGSNREQERHNIVVLTSPPQENRYKLSITLVVDPQIAIVPEVISFGHFDNYQKLSPKEAVIISNSVTNAKFIDAKSNQSYIAVDCIDKSNFNKRELGRIRIKLVSQPPDDNFEGSIDIYIKTDEGEKKQKLEIIGYRN